MEIQHVYVHAGEEEGAGRGEKWLPLHLGEMKSPQSPERRKTLAGQKSNSQGRLRERERKIYQTFSPLRQIVYVVKPETWSGNSELLYMKCTFNGFQTSGQLVKGFQTAVTWFCVSYFKYFQVVFFFVFFSPVSFICLRYCIMLYFLI